MTVVHIDEAKAQLPRLVDMAVRGNDVVIARGGKPVARLTRLRASKTRLKFGVLKGRIKTSADFDAVPAYDF